MSDLDAVKQMFASLTEQERLDVMLDYCRHCGVCLLRPDGRRECCHCYRDE